MEGAPWARQRPLRCGCPCRLRHVTDNRLAAFSHRHMLHGDFLLATRPVTPECLHLRGKRSRQLVQRALRAVLLRNALDMG